MTVWEAVVGYQTLRISGNMDVVVGAVKDARLLALSPHYVRASATDKNVVWIAEAKANSSLLKILEQSGWFTHADAHEFNGSKSDSASLKPVSGQKVKRNSTEKPTPETFKRSHGVRGSAYWKMMEQRRLERVSRQPQKLAGSERTFEIRIILFSKRGFEINQELLCNNCNKLRKPVFRYKESTEGQVCLCKWCKEHVYERSHGNSSNDAMHKAVMRKRSYG